MTIQVVDYGASNLRSVVYALDRIGVTSQVVSSASDWIQGAPVLLPGVGHFASMVKGLRDHGLWERIETAIDEEVPLLGICLGMQVLFNGSEEAPSCAGFGVFPDEVRRFPPWVKVPQMGWNGVEMNGQSTDFYFANSFYAPISSATVGFAEYGVPFSAVVRTRSITGMQFHPEKSGASGLELLRAWCEEVTCSASA